METTDFISEAEFATTFAELGTILFLVAWVFAILPFNWAKRIFAHLLFLSLTSLILSHIGPSFLDKVPLVAWLGLGFLVALSLLRMILVPFLGSGGAQSAVGNIFANIFMAFFVPLLLPFKLIKRLMNGRE